GVLHAEAAAQLEDREPLEGPERLERGVRHVLAALEPELRERAELGDRAQVEVAEVPLREAEQRGALHLAHEPERLARVDGALLVEPRELEPRHLLLPDRRERLRARDLVARLDPEGAVVRDEDRVDAALPGSLGLADDARPAVRQLG